MVKKNSQEIAWLLSKTNKEVEDDRKKGDCDKGDGNIDESEGKRLYEWVIHRSSWLPEHNRSLREKSRNLSHGCESCEEDGAKNFVQKAYTQ